MLPQRTPGCSFVSGIGGPLERVDKDIDKGLKHLIRELPSFVLDSTDILRRLVNLTIPDDCVLAGVDVESLYSSIPHEVGIHAVSQWLDTHHSLAGPHNELLVELLEMVLKNNFFIFNRKYYEQRGGVSMGAACAPSYAWGRGRRSMLSALVAKYMLGKPEGNFVKKWGNT